jgi:tetratricopeptide (TPR) repeat protein
MSNDQRSSIVEQGEGNPLFIEELTRSCLAEDRTEPMPLRLQELFTWRFKAPRVDVRVVQVAATVGPTFDAATVSAVFGDEETVARQLTILTEAGIIEPGGDPSAHTYRFRHALMRDAAYETQVLDVRRQTHASVADTIARHGAEPALIAEHLDRAGETQRAIGLYLVAAQAEQSRGAHTEATRLLSRSLALLDSVPESEERDLSELTARLLRGLSVSTMLGYAAPDVQSDHRRAEVLATRLGNRPEVLASMIAIWAYWLISGDHATAEGLIDRLTEMVRQPAFSSFEPEVLACAGYQEFYEGEFVSAMRHLGRATEGHLARPAEQVVSPFWPLPNDPVAVCQIALACLSTMRGEAAQAEDWERRALSRAEGVGFPRGPFSVAFVKVYMAWIRRFLGDHDASRSLGAQVVAIGKEHGYAYWTVLGASYFASDTPGGEPDRDHLEHTITMLRLMGQEAFAASNLGYLAYLDAAAGHVDRAHDLVSEAIQVVHKTREYVHLPELLRARATYALARGRDPAEAVEDLTEAVRVATEQGARVARLRSAIELARVPVSARPDSWRAWLEEARRDMPSSLSSAETAAADALLAE